MTVLLWIFFWLIWRVLVLKGLDRREAFLGSFVISAVCCVLATEMLTFVSAVRFWPLCLFWSMACAVVLAYLYRRHALMPAWPAAVSFDLFEKLLLGGCSLILLVTGFIALFAPPNTWDSMTYHMARVGHWVQNGGVMNYPTHIIRQLVSPPYAEYAILHAQLLQHGDRFANLVQWTALLGSALGASLLAREFGLGRFFQIAAAFLFLAMPMAILQGSSTQNDLVLSLWVVIAVYGLLVFMRTALRRWALLAALAFGLASLTKAGALAFVMPFALWAVFKRAFPWKRKVFLVGSFLLAFLTLTGPFHIRLMQIDPNPYKAMASVADSMVLAPNAGTALSNIGRSLATELALPWSGWNRGVVDFVGWLHRMIGEDMSDVATTFSGPFGIGYSLDEDYASNPLQMLFILAAFILCWFVRSKGLLWRGYGVALIAAGSLFCIPMKWQPFICRLHLPFFVLAIPWAMGILAKALDRKVVFLLGIVFLAALHPLVANNTRRLVSRKTMLPLAREQIYFAKRLFDYPIVMQTADGVKKMGCRQIGLVIGANDWEYPWMMALGGGRRIEHVHVTGLSAGLAYPLGDFVPCAVVVQKGFGTDWQVSLGRTYARAATSDHVDTFVDVAWLRQQPREFWP